MDGNEYMVGDVLVEIGGRHKCRIDEVDNESGFYLCEWLTYPLRMKDYDRFEDIDRYYVKVDGNEEAEDE
jgi:hypothetical protein